MSVREATFLSKLLKIVWPIRDPGTRVGLWLQDRSVCVLICTCLRAVQSVQRRSRSLVYIASNKSDLFRAEVALRQDCPLSQILYISFIDRISKCSQGAEEILFGDLRISSLLMWFCWLHHTVTSSSH